MPLLIDQLNIISCCMAEQGFNTNLVAGGVRVNLNRPISVLEVEQALITSGLEELCYIDVNRQGDKIVRPN